MIRAFKDKNTKAIYDGKPVKKFNSFARQAERRLLILDSAATLNDLRNLPSNRFEYLKGDRRGQYSIRINSQWRVCFRWIKGEPQDVEIVDYY